MSHVGIRFGSHLPCQELEAAEFLTSWDTPTAGLGYVLEMRQKVGNCSKSRFSTVKSGFQQKTDHKQVLDPRPDFSWDMDLQGIYILYRNPIWHFQQGPQQGDGLSFSEALDFFQWRFADLLDREMGETGAITTDAEDLRILRSLPEHAEFVQPLLRGHIAFSCFLSLRFTLTSN